MPLWTVVATFLSLPDLHYFRRTARLPRDIARQQVLVGRYLAKTTLDNALRVVPFFARPSIRGLVDRNMAVLSGSAALKALARDTWTANDVDLFAVLDEPTVKAVALMLEEIRELNLAKSLVFSTSLGERAGAISQGLGPSPTSVELVREPGLFRELTKKAWGLQMQPRVSGGRYLKVGNLVQLV